ncbi:hypothetical protein EV701_11871 [Chthoniobacter flavus]|nr:hypothetical protein EV701_11871 [Chthoniobacter flavus]
MHAKTDFKFLCNFCEETLALPESDARHFALSQKLGW